MLQQPETFQSEETCRGFRKILIQKEKCNNINTLQFKERVAERNKKHCINILKMSKMTKNSIKQVPQKEQHIQLKQQNFSPAGHFWRGTFLIL